MASVFKNKWTYILALIFLIIDGIYLGEPMYVSSFLGAFTFYVLLSALIIKIILWIKKLIGGEKK